MSQADKLSELQRRAEQLKTQLAAIKTQQREEEKKRLKRRRAIVGEAVIKAAQEDPAFAATLRAVLRRQAISDKDKADIADLLAAEAAPRPVPGAAP